MTLSVRPVIVVVIALTGDSVLGYLQLLWNRDIAVLVVVDIPYATKTLLSVERIH